MIEIKEKMSSEVYVYPHTSQTLSWANIQPWIQLYLCVRYAVCVSQHFKFLPIWTVQFVLHTHNMQHCFASTKNFSAHAQLPVSGSAANVLHVIQHFHVIIIHHSLSFLFFSTKLSLKENSALCGALCQLSVIVMRPCQPLLMSDKCVVVAPLLLVRVIKRSRSTPQHNFSVIRAYFLPFLHT